MTVADLGAQAAPPPLFTLKNAGNSIEFQNLGGGIHLECGEAFKIPRSATANDNGIRQLHRVNPLS